MIKSQYKTLFQKGLYFPKRNFRFEIEICFIRYCQSLKRFKLSTNKPIFVRDIDLITDGYKLLKVEQIFSTGWNANTRIIMK